ncbi:hypothetical protein ACFE04_000985 [Oxalis oulophora]
MKEIRELGGEVRRLHIIYFVTHMDMGRIEHPHLIRVRRLNAANGVYLRDVKRWLAELRGKEMPDAFAWSYKRRYRSGYIWQDLVDDDLITPISDDEYVLKGSEITPPSSSSANYHFGPTDELVIDDQKEQRYAITPPQPQETATCQNSSSIDSLTTFKSSSSKSRMRKNFNSRSGSSSKASLIRNFITCRAEDANEQVIIMSKQPRNVDVAKPHQNDNNTCKPQHTRTREFASSKTVSVVYKPVGGPTCS